jgi:hypothetical protein
MIVLNISDRVKPPPPFTPVVYTGNQHVPAVSTGTVYQEVLRRDKVIKDLVKEFKHVVGDEIEPKHEDDLKKYGVCKVLGICSEYIHLEKDFKWPKNDNPMIITASSDNGEIFYATTNYFK